MKQFEIGDVWEPQTPEDWAFLGLPQTPKRVLGTYQVTVDPKTNTLYIAPIQEGK